MTEQSEATLWRRIAAPLFLLRAVGQGSEFVGWVLLARNLGVTVFGALSIAFLVARYVGLLADWGASIGGPRDVARDDAQLSVTRALVAHRRKLTVALGLAFLVGCAATGHFEMAPVVTVIAMLGLSRDWIAVGHHQGARAATPQLVQGAVLLIVAVFFASAESPALAVACGYTGSTIASVALNRLPRRRSPYRSADRSTVPLRPWMLGAVMTNQVLSSSDVLVLGLFGTATATGVYSAVYRIPNGWMAGVSILAGALLPVATRASRDPSRLSKLRRGSFKVSIGAALVLVLITPLVFVAIPRLFGEQYKAGQWPAAVLLLATAIATAAAPLHQFYLTSGDGSDRRYAGFLGVSAVTIVVAGIVLIPRYSMMGAATATLLAHVTLAGILTLAVFGGSGGGRPTPSDGGT